MAKNHHAKHKVQSRRPHFNPRQVLTSEQLNQEQAFHIASLQRALHGLAGTGVVYGFNISSAPSEHPDNRHLQHKKGLLHVSCGLAFDQHGHQLEWQGGWISVDHLAGEPPDEVGDYTLFVHYAEHHITGSKEFNACGNSDNDADSALWIDQSVVFTLKKGRHKKEHERPKTHDCVDINGYVCERLSQEHCYQEPDRLCPTHCEGEYYDSHHGIALACVSICQLSAAPEQCSQLGFCDEKASVCEYRPFVYRNELLYELIRGDHHNYPRVEKLSWQDWILYSQEWQHQVPWKQFKDRFKGDGFSITFSKPIQTRTLHPGSIILSAVVREMRTDYWESRRIPLKIIHHGHGDYTHLVTLKFEDSWLRSEISDERSTLQYSATIELTIRGALIRDECGCMLDARPLGYQQHGHHCRQSLPGGDFIALFRVAPKEEKPELGHGNSPVQSAE